MLERNLPFRTATGWHAEAETGSPLIHRDPTSVFSQEGAPPREGGGTLSVTAVVGAVAEGAASTPTPAGLPASEGCHCPATGRPSSLAETSSPNEVTQAKLPLHPSGRERNRALPLASSHCAQPMHQTRKPPRGPAFHGESELGFSVPGPQARTHQSWTQWWKKPGPPRAQLEDRKQALKKIWQLEPLFLVLF